MYRTLLAYVAIIVASISATAASNAGPDQFICGTTTFLGASPLAVGETGYWTVAQGAATFNNQLDPHSFVTGLSFGENILRWNVVDASGNSSDFVSIWTYSSAMQPANAGPDVNVTTWPDTVQLNGSTPIAPGECFWIVVSGSCSITDPTNPTTTVTALAVGSTVLQWSCTNGPCGTSNDFMTLGVVVGIEESVNANSLMRYDAVNNRLVFGQKSTAISVTIFDQQGRVVHQLIALGDAGVWDLSAMSPGVYLAQMYSPGSNTTLRFATAH